MISRILLKPALGGVRIVALSISSHDKLTKSESGVFLNRRFSLFLEDLLFQIN